MLTGVVNKKEPLTDGEVHEGLFFTRRGRCSRRSGIPLALRL